MKKYFQLFILAIAVLGSNSSAFAQGAKGMPSDEALQATIRQGRAKASAALDEVMAEYGANAGQRRQMPDLDAKSMRGVDPGDLAEKYQNMLNKVAEAEVPKLILFVSLSMPEASLKKLAEQAKLTGGVLMFRGLKFGIKNYRKSMGELKPIAEIGATIQIHPDLFKRFNITAVPTMVITAVPKPGCQTDACAAQSAAVSGDVSLDYALEQLTDRKDEIGKIARDRLKRLRNS